MINIGIPVDVRNGSQTTPLALALKSGASSSTGGPTQMCGTTRARPHHTSPHNMDALDHGADVDVLNKAGRSTAESALENGQG